MMVNIDLHYGTIVHIYLTRIKLRCLFGLGEKRWTKSRLLNYAVDFFFITLFS